MPRPTRAGSGAVAVRRLERKARRGLRMLRRAWLIGLSLALLGCGHSAAAREEHEDEVIPVLAETAERARVPIAVHAIGTVTAISTVELRSRVDAQIERVFFREGEEVKQGQQLFQLDARPFELQLQRARADLARDEAQLRNAELDAKRYAGLFQQKLISAQENEQRATTFAVQRATLQSDRSAVAKAELDLAYTRIDAPISGRTGSVQVTAGNLIKANADPPLTVIRALSPIYVVFAVAADRLDEIRTEARGQTLSVIAAARGEHSQPATGQLSFIDSAVDVATGTIALKATFENTDRGFWPGEFVDVTLTLRTVEGTVIPAQAVQAGQRGQQVFVINADQTVTLREVTLGPRADESVVIERGIAPGEQVVTDGQLNLVPGRKVTIKSATPAGSASSGASP